MESHGPTASSSVASTTTIAVRAFSETIAVTYVGLGLFGLILLITSLYDLHQAVVSRLPWLLIPCAVLLSFGDRFHVRNVGAPPTTQLGAVCSSVVLAAVPNLDSLYDRAKWVASTACSWSPPIFKRGTTSWRTFCRVGDPLFHGHVGIDRDLLLVAESQCRESI
jgi:hypothetical protein